MIVANQHAIQRQKGLVGSGATFAAHARAAKMIEPGQGAFDHLAVTREMGHFG